MNITCAINEAVNGKEITRDTPSWKGLRVICIHDGTLKSHSLYIINESNKQYLWAPSPEDISSNDWLVVKKNDNTGRLGTQEFESLCKRYIANDLNEYHREQGLHFISDDIYTVWMCKVLQNNKGLFSSNNPDNLYYECTYNGDKQELYIDRYFKQNNKCIKVGIDDDAEYYSSGFVATSSGDRADDIS